MAQSIHFPYQEPYIEVYDSLEALLQKVDKTKQEASPKNNNSKPTHESFKEFLKKLKPKGLDVGFTDENSNSGTHPSKPKIILITSEPGIGKSRFLFELKNIIKAQGSFYHIELPHIKIPEIPSGKSYYFLDSLDEEWDQPIDTVFEGIMDFAIGNPQATIIIGCRIRHISRLTTVCINQELMDVSFRRLLPLTTQQTRNCLKYKFDEKNANWIDQTIESIGDASDTTYFGKKGYTKYVRNLLHTPRYLSYLCQIVLAKGGVEALIDPKLKRPSLGYIMGESIDLILKEEFVKIPLKEDIYELTYHKEPALLLQQKLALLMHLRSRTYFYEKEMAIISSELNSQEFGKFHRAKELRYFHERCLLKSTSGYLEFDNKDILDYLASKELIRMGEKHLPHVVAKLCIDNQTQCIGPQWWETLFFLCDQSPDFQFLEHLMDHAESQVISRQYPPLEVRGNFEQKQSLIQRIMSRLDVQRFSSSLKKRVFEFVSKFTKDFYPEGYGHEYDIQILNQSLDSQTLPLLNELFTQGHHKLVLAVFMESKWPYDSLQIGGVDWTDRFFQLFFSGLYPEDTNFVGHVIITFFDPLSPIPFELRIKEMTNEDFHLPERNYFVENFIPVFEKYKKEIASLSVELQKALYYKKIKAFEQYRPPLPELVDAYADWYRLFYSENDSNDNDELDIFSHLTTKERWNRFFDYYLHKKDFREAVLASQEHDKYGHSFDNNVKKKENEVFSILDQVMTENQNQYREKLFQALVISYKEHNPRHNLVHWNLPLIMGWGRILFMHFPKSFLSFSQQIGITQHEDDFQFFFGEFFINSSSPPFQTVKRIFEQLKDEFPLAAYRLLNYSTIYNEEEQKQMESWEHQLSKELVTEQGQRKSDYVKKEEHRKAKRDQDYNKYIAKAWAELINLLDKYRQDSEGEIHPIEVFSYIIKNENIFQSGLKNHESTVQQVLDDYFQTYPDLRKVNVITEDGKNFSTQPEAFIWELDRAMEIIRLFPNLFRESYREVLIRSILIIKHQDGITWWKKKIWELLNETEKKNLIEEFSNRKDHLMLYIAEWILPWLKEQKSPQTIPLFKRILEAPAQFKNYSEFAAISSLKFLKQTFPQELTQSYLEHLSSLFKDNENLKDEVDNLLIDKYLDRKVINERIREVIGLIDHLEDPFRKTTSKPWEGIGINIRGVSEEEGRAKMWTGILKAQNDHSLISDYVKLVETAFGMIANSKNPSSDFKSIDAANNLINICYAYFNNLDIQYHGLAIRELKKAIERSERTWGSKIKKVYDHAELRRKSIDKLFSTLSAGDLIQQSLSHTIHTYNHFNGQRFEPIWDHADLQRIVEDILQNEIRTWVEAEGAYKYIKATTNKGQIQEGEYMLQVSLHDAIKSRLLEKGLQPNQILLTREEQKNDNKRTDFLVRYGMFGPIAIEVKQAHNDQVRVKTEKPTKEVKEYVEVMKNYIEGFHTTGAILLVIKTRPDKKVHQNQAQILTNLYQEKLPQVKVIYIDGVGHGDDEE